MEHPARSQAASKYQTGGHEVKKKMDSSTGSLFRFQDLEIWKKAIEIGNKLFDIADELERKKLFRFAEQVRAAGLSMSNNISEGSGSFSDREFARFLNIARRSTFENANMVIVFEKRDLIGADERDDLLQDLEEECKMISGFIRTLKEDE
jgi:four helix bundle protein